MRERVSIFDHCQKFSGQNLAIHHYDMIYQHFHVHTNNLHFSSKKKPKNILSHIADSRYQQQQQQQQTFDLLMKMKKFHVATYRNSPDTICFSSL